MTLSEIAAATIIAHIKNRGARETEISAAIVAANNRAANYATAFFAALAALALTTAALIAATAGV